MYRHADTGGLLCLGMQKQANPFLRFVAKKVLPKLLPAAGKGLTTAKKVLPAVSNVVKTKALPSLGHGFTGGKNLIKKVKPAIGNAWKARPSKTQLALGTAAATPPAAMAYLVGHSIMTSTPNAGADYQKELADGRAQNIAEASQRAAAATKRRADVAKRRANLKTRFEDWGKNVLHLATPKPKDTTLPQGIATPNVQNVPGHILNRSPSEDAAANIAGVTRSNQHFLNKLRSDKALAAGSATPRDVLKDWYKNTPGGFDQAVLDAQKAMKNRPSSGAITNFHKWRPKRVDEEISVKQVPNDPKSPDMRGSFGYAGTQLITYPTDNPNPPALTPARVRLHKDPSGRPRSQASGTLDHEMTHHLTTPQSDEERMRDYPASMAPVSQFSTLSPHTQRLLNSGTKADYSKYSTTPTELDPRIAEAKRQYTLATGTPVNNAKAANDALQWYLFSGRGDRTTLFRLSMDPKARRLIIQRMLELVQNTSSYDKGLKIGSAF